MRCLRRKVHWTRIRLGLPFIVIGGILTLFLLSYFAPCHLPKTLTKRSLSSEETQQMIKTPEYETKESIMNKMIELRRIMERATQRPDLMDVKMEEYNKTNSISELKMTTGQIPITRRYPTIPTIPEKPVNMSNFRQKLTSTQKQSLFASLLALRSVAELRGFVWMLYSGSLLGSWRHHNMIPWDDDVDIFMSLGQKSKIIEALSELAPDFGLYVAKSRLKFWARNGTEKFPHLKWHYPFVDISFFSENKTHIWDASAELDYGDRAYVYNKSIVFPLHLRYFGKYFFPAPRDSFLHLLWTYSRQGIFYNCETNFYSHAYEKVIQSFGIPCKYLQSYYPFVHRRTSDSRDGIIESLRFNGETIYSIFVAEPPYATLNLDPVDAR